MQKTRAFIAIPVEGEVRAALTELQARLKNPAANIRWMNPDALHLTLAFLGDIPAEKTPALGAALDENVSHLKSFPLRIQGVGVFGRRDKPGVVWAGVAETPDLLTLRERVARAVAAANIPFAACRFRPHLTLGRFKTPERATPIFPAMEKENDAVYGEIRVEAVELFKSELKPAGAEHTSLHRAALV